MYNRNLGDQIKDIVEDVVNSGDYSDLNRKIKNTVESAVDECKRATNGFIHGNDPNDQWIRGNSFHGRQRNRHQRQNFDGRSFQGDPFHGTSFEQGTSRQAQNAYNKQKNYRNNNSNYNRGNQYNTSYAKGQQKNTAVMYRQPVKGSVSSIFSIIFGSIGTFLFGAAEISLLVEYFQSASNTGDQIGALVVGFVLTMLSAWGMGAGIRKRRYITRYQKYRFLLQKNKFCEIKRLAEQTNVSKKKVKKDLQKMVSEMLFPEGRFDEKKTYFMLDEKTYQQYQASQQSYKERVKEQEKTREKEVEERTEKQEKRETNPELAKAIDEGNVYLKGIREANDDIPGEEISRKLDRLEDIIRKIFVCVEKHPEKLPEIRKLMEYYLPITMKLVNAYKEFDSQPVQGENITNSKKEIEETLDTIDLAFQKLLDSLYEEEAMEVYSDISVLNALFAQEGLTKKDFDMK